MNNPKRFVLYLILAFVGLLISTQSQPITQAQDDPEAEINRLAAELHIQNSRWGRATSWIGGQLGNGDASSNPRVGQVLTDWTLTDMYDQNITFDINDLERPVVMNLWASWCGPCRFEFPLLTEYAERDDLNFDLWFVNTGDTTLAAGQRFLRDQSDQLTTMYDPDDRFAASLGLRAYPTTLLMDTDGTIIATHAGIVTNTVMDFLNALALAPREGGIDTSGLEFDLLEYLQPIDPENATPLIYNQQAAGILNDEDWRDDFSFVGTANEEVIINLTYVSDEVEAYIAIIGPDGQLVTPNEERSSIDVSGISLSVTLPQDGTYVIVVSRFLEDEGFGEGGYNIIINNANTVSNNDGSAALTIASGIPSTGILTYERKQQAYILDVSAGQTVTFTLTHDLPEEELSLQARMGNTRLVPYTKTTEGQLEVVATVEESGRYSVYVARSNSSRAGPITYTLTVDIEGDAVPVDSSQDDSAIRIAYGDTVTGTINNETVRYQYQFEGRAGDVINIDLVGSDNLDTYLILLGPDGEILAENDDAEPVTTDAGLSGFVLPSDGTYTIVATRFLQDEGLSEGEFTLTLTLADEVVSDDSAVVDGLLSYGDTVSGTITDTVYEQRFTFEGNAGDVVSIEVEAVDGSLDTTLALLGPDGELLIENDDIDFTSTNSAIIDFELPTTGRYTIVVSRFNGEDGRSVGDFSLRLNTSDAPSVDSPSEPVLINFNESIIGQITDRNFENTYTFEANAGDVVTIEVRSDQGSDLDANLTLIGPDGAILTANDDRDLFNGDLDPIIRNFELPSDGTYTIIVGRYLGDEGLSTGEYTLTLTQGDPEAVNEFTLTYGQTVTGRLDDANYQVDYRFSGQAGDVISVLAMATSGDLDTTVLITAPTGEFVAFNDDFNDLDAAVVGVTLPQDGIYTLTVGRFMGLNGTSSGSYELRLVEGTDLFGISDTTVDTDTSTATNATSEVIEFSGTISSESPTQNFTFSAQAGDVVTIEMVTTDGNLDPLLILEGPTGQEIARNDDESLTSVNALLSELTLSQSGTYTIIATRYQEAEGISEGAFSLTVRITRNETVRDASTDTPSSATLENGTPAEVITFGETVTGTIDDENLEDRYVFEGNAGQVITIVMTTTSGSLDPYISLFNEQGVEIAYNDDNIKARGRDAIILNFKLPTDGVYTIVATRYGVSYGVTVGDYELSLSRQN